MRHGLFEFRESFERHVAGWPFWTNPKGFEGQFQLHWRSSRSRLIKNSIRPSASLSLFSHWKFQALYERKCRHEISQWLWRMDVIIIMHKIKISSVLRRFFVSSSNDFEGLVQMAAIGFTLFFLIFIIFNNFFFTLEFPYFRIVRS